MEAGCEVCEDQEEDEGGGGDDEEVAVVVPAPAGPHQPTERLVLAGGPATPDGGRPALTALVTISPGQEVNVENRIFHKNMNSVNFSCL